MLGEETLNLKTLDRLKRNVVLCISLLDTCFLRVLLTHDDIFAALWEVKHAEEELCAFLGAYTNYIVGLALEMVIRCHRHLCC